MAALSRRTFFQAGLAPAFLAGAQTAKRRPNLLFLIADDHAGYAMGCDGNRHALTPNLDRLANEGIRFSHAYCNCPVCTPSRQSLLTGQMPSAAGVTRLPTPLALGKPTFSEQLRKAGFHTGVIGKMHLHREPRPGLFGFDMMLTEDALERQWRKDVPARPVPEGVRTRKMPWLPLKDPARLWLNADCLPYPRRDEEMESTYAAHLAGEFLEANAHRPFALWVSFTEPHSPFDFPLEDRGRFHPKDFHPPKPGPEDAWQIPLCFKDLSVEDKQGISAAYYTSVHYLDRNIGRVLGRLRALGLEENTLVVYVGDNGYCLGEHGRIEKHCGFEPALRVPLLMRLRGRSEPTVVTDLVEMLDIAPTILEMLDAPPLAVQHGQSLRPYLDGRKHPTARRHIVSEYPENEEVYVRTERWKLIHGSGRRARRDGLETANPTPGRYVLLYDEQADPGEMHNLAARHPEVVRELQQAALARFRATHPDAANEPAGAPLEDALEFYLPPRDPERKA
ncbi:MAG: sulfatase-like hydrolase/transferase [Bryobacterales bacterium]|nr:sulfatase-like hydrolase/transferase [Bryobacterales bacterium]